MNFWEIMQGMVPDSPMQDISPWSVDDDYMNTLLADYINRTGQSYYNITAEDLEGGWTPISDEMTWHEGESGTYGGWVGSGPNAYWNPAIPYYTEGSYETTGMQREINFETWKENYADYFPTFQMQDYDRLVDQHLFDKENLISDLTQNIRSANFDPRAVIGSGEDRSILENTINVSSKLKDLSHINQVSSLLNAYEDDLYSAIGDLANTGAFDFLTNPEELEWIDDI